MDIETHAESKHRDFGKRGEAPPESSYDVQKAFGAFENCPHIVKLDGYRGKVLVGEH